MLRRRKSVEEPKYTALQFGHVSKDSLLSFVRIGQLNGELLRQRTDESFWGTLKNELIYRNSYATRREAMQEIK